MSGAFAWLNQLMASLGKWVPRLVLILPTHRGVLFGPRGRCRQTGPGLVIYWPITHYLLQVPVTTQSFSLSPQVLPATEKTIGPLSIPCALVCGAAIQFRVDDAIKAATRALHLHALVDNRASAAIAKFCDPAKDVSEWISAAAESLTAELKPYGVTLERLDLTQGALCVALKNISDWNYADNTKGTHVLGREE